MAFRVQEFRAAMNFDGARPNLFQCELTFPQLAIRGARLPTPVGGGGGLARGGDAQSKYTFMARAAQIPGSTVNQVSQFYFGRELKFSGNRTFPEWTVTIINDEDFIIRDAFERWMSGLNSHVRNLRAPEFIRGDGGYQSDGFITQFGKDGFPLKRYKFVGMFPVDVSPIEVDWSANDTIEEFAVTFAYQWWESSTTDSVGANPIISPLLPPIG